MALAAAPGGCFSSNDKSGPGPDASFDGAPGDDGAMDSTGTPQGDGGAESAADSPAEGGADATLGGGDADAQASTDEYRAHGVLAHRKPVPA